MLAIRSLLLQLSLVIISSSAPIPVSTGPGDSDLSTAQDTTAEKTSSGRQGKSLFFDYPIATYRTNEYGDPALEYDAMLMGQQDDVDPDDDLSRTLPSRKRYHGSNSGGDSNNAGFPNSPIYYIRLPATPYMFVPGLGYVSNPPTMNQLPGGPPPPDPFINLPLSFMSNGKPTNIYQWPDVRPDPFGRPYQQQQIAPQAFQQHGGYSHFDNGYRKKPPSYSRPPIASNSLYQNVLQSPAKPKPTNKPVNDSKVTHLKGPFAFNGRPTDIIVLRDSYNALYSDALTNFYP